MSEELTVEQRRRVEAFGLHEPGTGLVGPESGCEATNGAGVVSDTSTEVPTSERAVSANASSGGWDADVPEF